MTAGRVARCASGLVLALLSPFAAAAERAGELRVLSGPGATSAVTIRAEPDVQIEDRTTGAQPVAGPRGPASTGQTFAGEIDLFLRGYTVSRAASIDVADPVVSAVRLFPEPAGTSVAVFVRQPVTYSVARPSAIGEVRVEVRGKMRPLVVTPSPLGGRPRVTRPKPTGERELAVDAESLSYDQQTNVLTARGGVTLTREDTTLTADEVVYDRTNGVADAKGHVVLTDPRGTVEGESMHLVLDDESGWVDNGTALLEPSNFTLRADRLEKQGGPKYSAARGVFTSCQCGGLERPSWSLAGERTNVTLQGAGVVHGLTFRVKDTPVLWLPYFVFPASTERQTGLLVPRVGYSNRRGLQYEQPFYWKIDKSSDATIAVDVETEARVGLIGEYRYALSRDARGQFTAAYFNEQIRGRSQGTVAPGGGPADIPEDRYAFSGRHQQLLARDTKFYLDMFAVSDNFFLREINNFAFSATDDLNLRTTRFTTSRTGVVKTWSQGLAWVENAYYQDLIDPQALALQKLPRVEAQHELPLLGDHLVGRLGGEAVDYQREEGYAGLRGDLAPELFLPFNVGSLLQGSLAGRVRETAYHLTDDGQVALVVPFPDCSSLADPRPGENCSLTPNPECRTLPKKKQNPGVNCIVGPQKVVTLRHFREANELPSLADERTQESADLRGRLGTEVSRVFDFPHLGLGKLRHSIEPEVAYLYIPAVSRSITQRNARPCRRIQEGNLLRLAPGEVPGDNCEATLFGDGYLFDERDAVNRRNFLSFGITTRLLGRAATTAETAARGSSASSEASADEDEVGPPAPADHEGLAAGALPETAPDFVGPPGPPTSGAKTPPQGPARELVRASVLQGYDISRPLVRDSHLSDVDLGLRLNPLDYLTLSYDTTVGFEDMSLRGFTARATFREPGWTPSSLARYQNPATVSVAYRFIEENVNSANPQSAEGLTPGVNEVDAALYLRLGDYLGFSFLSRYNLDDSFEKNSAGQVVAVPPRFLERDYLVRIMSRCNCWMIDAGLADKTNPDERLFRVQLTLVGLGSFGQNPFSRTYVGFSPLSNLGPQRSGFGSAAGGLY